MPSLIAVTKRVAFTTLPLLATAAQAQSCTGLCLQQISCPAGGTTAVSGTVYAPNGKDPLPGVIVYIPNASVAAFTPGVSCAVAGQAPSGSPLVGTTTAVDGTFTLANVPVGNNIPLVIQSGRWRRQVTIPAVAACTNTAFSTRFPQNKTEGDIPKIAVVTGSADAVECVLRKVGVADTEFTDASGSGRINLFQASGSPGAVIDPQTPVADSLLANQTSLNGYDVLMLPCEGGAYTKSSGQLGNLISYANDGGRVYASHFSYDWFVNNGAFNTVVNWEPNQAEPQPSNGIATIDTSFAQGQTLTQWLGVVGATATPGQVAITSVRHDLSTVNAPTQAWLTLNNAAYGNPIMQFTFDTPVGSTTNACGRVLFNEYHVENSNNTGKLSFPTECSGGAMTAQEKLLEFNLFDLTGNGTPPTLTPASSDFGTEPVGSTTGAQKFFWTNNTYFPAVVSSAAGSGDFAVTKEHLCYRGGRCKLRDRCRFRSDCTWDPHRHPLRRRQHGNPHSGAHRERHIAAGSLRFGPHLWPGGCGRLRLPDADADQHHDSRTSAGNPGRFRRLLRLHDLRYQPSRKKQLHRHGQLPAVHHRPPQRHPELRFSQRRRRPGLL